MLRFILHRINRLTAKRKSTDLVLLLNDRREAVRLAAVRALGLCADDLAYEAVLPLLCHSEASVRKHAVLALSDMNRPEGRARIEAQKLIERDACVLSAIESALLHCKP